MGRLEHKYLIPNSKLDGLREYIRPYVRTDPYAEQLPENQYTVRSIYFDTATLQYYYEKLAGIKVRKKVRVRGYNEYREDDLVFLEIKRKHVSVISKDRSPVRFTDLAEIMNTRQIEEYIFTENGYRDAIPDGKKFLYQVLKNNLHPVIKVTYEREPFVYRFDRSLRITFDKNLRGSARTGMNTLYQDESRVHPLCGFFVLEIKSFKPYPSWLNYLISELNVRHQAISKYTICIDALKDVGINLQCNRLRNNLRQTSQMSLS